jgi:glycine oxidase
MRSTDLAVVGGGIIGLAVAWRAARAGLAVTLVDPAPGEGATRASAGMLAPVAEAAWGEETLVRPALAAADRWSSFARELAEATGADLDYVRVGSLVVAADASDGEWLSELAGFHERLGLAVRRLRSRECREAEPLLAPGVRAGVLVEEEARVDPRRAVAALLEALGAAGVAIVRERVRRVTVERDTVTGLALESGSHLPAAQVVVAAGCASARIEGLPQGDTPCVRPVRGQILRLLARGAQEVPRRTVRAIVHGSRVYIVPRGDGHVVVGATQEERGFDDVVTAGGVWELLRDALAIVPGLSELPLVECASGLRPGSPDNAPLVGPTSVRGLHLATGHYRNGVLLAPLTADLVLELLRTGSVPELGAPFDPRRFRAHEVAS